MPRLILTPPAGLCEMTRPAGAPEAPYLIREPRPAAVRMLCATVLSSLKTLGAPVEPLLAAAGIVPTARAEELSVAEFCALARALQEIAV